MFPLTDLSVSVKSNAGCTDDNGCWHFDLTSPGIDNLNQQRYWVCGQPGNNPNDRVTSYQCWDW